jgi:hypothetical protein
MLQNPAIFFMFKYNFIKFLRNSATIAATTTTAATTIATTTTTTTNSSSSSSQSVIQLVPSCFESPVSIPGQSKRDLWWMKGHWNMFSLVT